jgi:hypothetical protein
MTAYLAALAIASGCRLVFLDADFQTFDGLKFLHLRPDQATQSRPVPAFIKTQFPIARPTDNAKPPSPRSRRSLIRSA